MKQIKCPNCKQWNENVSRCTFCDTALVAEELNREYRQMIEAEDSAKEDGKAFKYFQSLKTSKYMLVRMTYQVLFGIWSVYMFFVAVFTWIIATTVG